ncbi:hypothetical protein GCM10023156_39270 [Novipirellula rosea]|uniref:Uncharacterized protein n=1 Tax=Novipirellula rosea TaxID=1031540 RepID=A0ABP8N4X1_9BACT
MKCQSHCETISWIAAADDGQGCAGLKDGRLKDGKTGVDQEYSGLTTLRVSVLKRDAVKHLEAANYGNCVL